MSILEDNNFRLNLKLLLEGLKRNFLSIPEILRELENYVPELLTVDEYSELYIDAEYSESKFLQTLESYSNRERLNNESINRMWAFNFLKRIYNSKRPTEDKLIEISKIWALFGYPKQWSSFIHYMPIQEEIPEGKKEVYQRFESFLSAEEEYFKKNNWLN
jgi:hypothetical protein